MPRPLAYEATHRFGYADIIEGGGSEFPCQEVNVSVKPLCNFFRLFHFLAYFSVARAALIDRREIKPQRSHLLADLIVYVASDAAALILLRAHNLAEQAHSISFGLYALRDFIAKRLVDFREFK